MVKRIDNILMAVLPILFLYGAYWFVGFIPITYVYCPNLEVYREPITVFGIAAFILTFLVIAVGVFNIRNIKRLGLIFLIYQPIKLIVDLTGRLYENQGMNHYIFCSVNFLTLFLCIGTAVVIWKNKDNGNTWHTDLARFSIRCTIPVLVISIAVPILEIVIMWLLLERSVPFGAEEFFNSVVIVMSVTSAVLTLVLGIFMQLGGAAFERDSKLFSVDSLKPLAFSVLFSVVITVAWRLSELGYHHN